MYARTTPSFLMALYLGPLFILGAPMLPGELGMHAREEAAHSEIPPLPFPRVASRSEFDSNQNLEYLYRQHQHAESRQNAAFATNNRDMTTYGEHRHSVQADKAIVEDATRSKRDKIAAQRRVDIWSPVAEEHRQTAKKSQAVVRTRGAELAVVHDEFHRHQENHRNHAIEGDPRSWQEPNQKWKLDGPGQHKNGLRYANSKPFVDGAPALHATEEDLSRARARYDQAGASGSANHPAVPSVFEQGAAAQGRVTAGPVQRAIPRTDTQAVPRPRIGAAESHASGSHSEASHRSAPSAVVSGSAPTEAAGAGTSGGRKEKKRSSFKGCFGCGIQ